VTQPAPPEAPADKEPPGLPGFRTWRSVYLLVVGWFVLVVALLAAFSWMFR
jgi:hypothetical protein